MAENRALSLRNDKVSLSGVCGQVSGAMTLLVRTNKVSETSRSILSRNALLNIDCDPDHRPMAGPIEGDAEADREAAFFVGLCRQD